MDHNFHFENARDSPSQMNFVNGFSVKSFITLLHGREIGSGMPPAIYILPIFMEIHMVMLGSAILVHLLKPSFMKTAISSLCIFTLVESLSIMRVVVCLLCLGFMV